MFKGKSWLLQVRVPSLEELAQFRMKTKLKISYLWHLKSNTFEVNGTLSGAATLSSSSCFQYKFGSSLIGKTLLPSEQILSLRVDPISARVRPPGKQTGSHENYFPLKTWRKKMDLFQEHLIRLYLLLLLCCCFRSTVNI